jgi:hypothetical protein
LSVVAVEVVRSNPPARPGGGKRASCIEVGDDSVIDLPLNTVIDILNTHDQLREQ